MTEIEKYHKEFEVDAFNAIGKSIIENDKMSHFDSIYLDEFKDKEGYEYSFIVLKFKNGAKCVRNAAGNSLHANIRSLSEMLDGNYYKEVEYYNSIERK